MGKTDKLSLMEEWGTVMQNRKSKCQAARDLGIPLFANFCESSG